jgi:asparagine synthase (glutamine-hydrolysing)
MLETMRHEPFYVSGSLSAADQRVWIGWMAHPGSFSARVSAYRHHDGSAVILSGECFGRLPGSSRYILDDPEAFAHSLIDAVRSEGPRYLNNLNGLFSGVIVDRQSRCSYVFNDRYSAERLYFAESGSNSVFASEAKAVLHAEPMSRALDPESVAQWIRFGSVLDGRTLFKGVRLVAGASVFLRGADGIQSWTRYFDRQEWEEQPQVSIDEFSEALTAAMADVVPQYLRGNHALGFAVTGGLDTRMIAAALPPEAQAMRAYTFGVAGRETLDQIIGRAVATRSGLSHDSILLGERWLEQFQTNLERTVWVTDGCAGATTSHEICFTSQSRALGPVRLTGNFGSEILRGVSTLKSWQPSPDFLSAEFVRTFEDVHRVETSIHPVSRAAFQEIPWHLFGSMAAGRSQVIFRTPYLDNRIVRLGYQLAVADRSSPGPATAVVGRLRPGLMDIPTDRGVSLHSGRAAHVARRAAAELLFKLDYWDKEGLPGSLWWFDPVLAVLRMTPWMGLHKYLAYRRWFRDELNGLVDRVAIESEALAPYCDPVFLKKIAPMHRSGRFNLLREINCMLTLATIHKLFINDDGRRFARPAAQVLSP